MFSTTSCEVFKMDSGRSDFFVPRAAASASASSGRSAALAGTKLVLAEISLNVTSDHLVQNRVGDVLQRLAQCSSHLILNLPLKEVVEGFALSTEI